MSVDHNTISLHFIWGTNCKCRLDLHRSQHNFTEIHSISFSRPTNTLGWIINLDVHWSTHNFTPLVVNWTFVNIKIKNWIGNLFCLQERCSCHRCSSYAYVNVILHLDLDVNIPFSPLLDGTIFHVIYDGTWLIKVHSLPSRYARATSPHALRDRGRMRRIALQVNIQVGIKYIPVLSDKNSISKGDKVPWR